MINLNNINSMNNITNNEAELRSREMLNKLVNSSREHYTIPSSVFSKSYIKRGLREADGTGVIAGVTRKGNVHGYIISDGERVPAKGELYYCGYNVEDLVTSFMEEGRFGFEETTYLLLFGKLPTHDELQQFDAIMDA